jgi:hypothetical protein
MLYCLGTNNEQNVCACSVQIQFFSSIFSLQLLEPMNAEPTDSKGSCVQLPGISNVPNPLSCVPLIHFHALYWSGRILLQVGENYEHSVVGLRKAGMEDNFPCS